LCVSCVCDTAVVPQAAKCYPNVNVFSQCRLIKFPSQASDTWTCFDQEIAVTASYDVRLFSFPSLIGLSELASKKSELISIPIDNRCTSVAPEKIEGTERSTIMLGCEAVEN